MQWSSETKQLCVVENPPCPKQRPTMLLFAGVLKPSVANAALSVTKLRVGQGGYLHFWTCFTNYRTLTATFPAQFPFVNMVFYISKCKLTWPTGWFIYYSKPRMLNDNTTMGGCSKLSQSQNTQNCFNPTRIWACRRIHTQIQRPSMHCHAGTLWMCRSTGH